MTSEENFTIGQFVQTTGAKSRELRLLETRIVSNERDSGSNTFLKTQARWVYLTLLLPKINKYSQGKITASLDAYSDPGLKIELRHSSANISELDLGSLIEEIITGIGAPDIAVTYCDFGELDINEGIMDLSEKKDIWSGKLFRPPNSRQQFVGSLPGQHTELISSVLPLTSFPYLLWIDLTENDCPLGRIYLTDLEEPGNEAMGGLERTYIELSNNLHFDKWCLVAKAVEKYDREHR